MANCHFCARCCFGQFRAPTNDDDCAQEGDGCDCKYRRLERKTFHRGKAKKFSTLWTKNLQHPSHGEVKRSGTFQGWLDLLQRRPRENEVLGACVAETNGGLHLVAGTRDVDDDPFTEDGVFNIIADA